MAEYSYVTFTKLVLKGTKAKSKKKKNEEKRKREEGEETQVDIVGIWWTVANGEISGTTVFAMDREPVHRHSTVVSSHWDTT